MLRELSMLNFLSATAAAVSSDDFSGVLDAITAQISVTTIVEILVACIGASVGFAFLWWGVRKVVRALMSAFKSGKINV